MCYPRQMVVPTQIHARPAALFSAVVVAVLIAACGKSDPPPDLIKTQRETLNKAKALSSVIEQSDQNSRHQIDDASK